MKRLVSVLAAGILFMAGSRLLAGEPRTQTVKGTDVASIIAAIDRCNAGDRLFLPQGTYSIDRAIQFKSRLRFVGAGQEQTVLRFTGSKPSALLRLVDCEDVEVSNLTLDGAKNTNATEGISGHNARKLHIHHVTIKDLVKGMEYGPQGIYFSGINPTAEKGVTDSIIADCLLENIGLGAEYGGGIRFAWGSSRNRIVRNTIRKTGRGGIFANDGCTDLVIQSNTVVGSEGEGLGIEVWKGCHRALIEDNRIDHWLSYDGSDYGAARRNIISDQSGAYKHSGIELVGSNYGVFTDNTIDDGQRIGISVSNKPAKNYVFWGFNTIKKCNEWGAQLQGEEGGIAYHYFYRCRFLSTSVGHGSPRYPGDEGRGFRINGDAHHVTLEECEIHGNERSGIQLGGRNVDQLCFLRCTIRNNKGPAVSGPTGYTALEWDHCDVQGNGDNSLPAAKPFATKAPLAAIAGPTQARAGEAVRFASNSKALSGNIKQVLWDFNDGVPATDAVTSHRFAKPGDYRVTLLIWDTSGRGARAEMQMKVVP
jgi:hypothetical protein